VEEEEEVYDGGEDGGMRRPPRVRGLRCEDRTTARTRTTATAMADGNGATSSMAATGGSVYGEGGKTAAADER
jgi:hypothetical protein